MISTIFYQTLFLTRNLSISSLEMIENHLVFTELKHILQNLAHSNIRTSKTFWCRAARILRCQIRLQYHLLHMWPHTSHQSPRFSRWELDWKGLPWQKKDGRYQIYSWLFYDVEQTCRRRPTDIHTYSLVLVPRSRIHDCLCWERNLVSLLDVAVSQCPKCLIYVWCC